MSTSPSSELSHSTSKGCFDKSSYYSSLPWFRRLLAMLNWRPVVDYEQSEREYEKRMQQLESEDAQLKREEEQRQLEHEQRMRQLKSENARLAELNSKLSAILSSSGTNSNPPPSTPDESEA